MTCQKDGVVSFYDRKNGKFLPAGGTVLRVRLGGRDLGAKGWTPYEREIPADLAGRALPLEINIVTSVRPIFGSARSPDAKLDHALWVRPELADPSPVGLRAAKVRVAGR